MYTILISNSDDEIKQTLKEICSGTGPIHVLDEETPSPKKDASCCLINTAKGIYNIPYRDILFVESGQKKSVIHLINGTICLPVALYRIREVLSEPAFVQTHRSFIVNLKNVSFIDKTKDPWTVSFFGSSKTAFVSRSFKKDVLQTLTPHLDCIAD